MSWLAETVCCVCVWPMETPACLPESGERSQGGSFATAITRYVLRCCAMHAPQRITTQCYCYRLALSYCGMPRDIATQWSSAMTIALGSLLSKRTRTHECLVLHSVFLSQCNLLMTIKPMPASMRAYHLMKIIFLKREKACVVRWSRYCYVWISNVAFVYPVFPYCAFSRYQHLTFISIIKWRASFNLSPKEKRK